MSDDLKVGRIVFDKNTVYAGTGVSCNPLEYAPRGTIEELYKAQDRIQELEGMIQQSNWKSEQDAQAVYERDQELATANKRLAEAEGFLKAAKPYIWYSTISSTELVEKIEAFLTFADTPSDFVLVRRDDLQLMKSWFAGGTEEMWAAMDRITAALEKTS